MTAQQFTPSKAIWTETDFAQMSWHDCRLHGIGIVDDFEPHHHELRLDIDYIFQWHGFGNSPEQPSGFWISPATLVFEPQHFRIDLSDIGGTWIIAIERVTDQWFIRFNTGGSITISAPGFRQYIRRAPVFVATPDQSLESSQRGAISFDTTTFNA